MARYFTLLAALLLAPGIALATPASQVLLESYKTEGAVQFDANRGKSAWTREIKPRHSCASCHGIDITQPGRHHTTEKIIEPMSGRVNPVRYTDEKKIEKWFKRNCKDTWGRECTAQEKGDFLNYLLSN